MYKWIICIGGSNEDGVIAYTYTATKDKVKDLLVAMVKDLISAETCETAEFFTESPDDVEERSCSLYAFVSFENYHIDVEAIKFKDIKEFPFAWLESV